MIMTIKSTLNTIYRILVNFNVCFSLLLLFSHYVQLFATPRTAAHEASLFFTISQSWLKLMY